MSAKRVRRAKTMPRQSKLIPLLLLMALCTDYVKAAENDAVDVAVRAKIKASTGVVSLYAKNLATGESFGLAQDAAVRTASTIKLAIMAECYAEAAEGKLKLTEPLEIVDSEKVSGSGIVQEPSGGVALPLRDMIDLMIVLSDNTATNLILNRIGGDAVNARMSQLGLVHTRVMRKILGDGSNLKSTPSGITAEGSKPENKKWGIGRSSPHEMVTLLEKLYRGELVSKAASDDMISILKHQRDRNGMGRDMQDIEIASKSGALDHLRSDVGIIYSPRAPIAMAITVDGFPEVNWTPDNPALLLISSLSQILVDGLGR